MSIYVLAGEEDLLKESALSKIKNKCLRGGDPSFNYISIDGKSTTSAQIIEECQQLPFMNDARLVIVKDADKIIDDNLLEYIKNPVETTCLVLIARKIDKRLGRYAEIQEFNHPTEKEITVWIRQYIQVKKKSISIQDAGYLADILENNLTGIVQELEKLITFAGSRNTITKRDIEVIISENKIRDSFTLTGAIQNKDTSGAIKIINELLNQGNSVQQIIGSVRWMLTRLWQVKDGNIQDLRIPSYFLNKLIEQAKKFSIADLKRGLITLLAIEKLMRTYTIPQRLILETLVIHLTQDTYH